MHSTLNDDLNNKPNRSNAQPLGQHHFQNS